MKRLRARISSNFAPWLVLGLSLTITFQLWQTEQTNIEQKAQARFRQETLTIKNTIKNRLEKYELMLQGCVGLFKASNSIDRREWRMYVQTLDPDNNYPGIQGIGFAQRVPAAEKQTHIRRLRAEGFPDYSIRPEGARAEYFPIIYIEPFSGRNLRAFSYDMFSEPVRRAAMEEARDHGEAAMSGKVQLVQETAQNVQAGFLIYLPLYETNLPIDTQEKRRAALRGFVYSPFRMDDFINGLTTWNTAAVQWEIYDGPRYDADAVLYRSGAAAPDTPDANPALQKKSSLKLFNRTWSLRFRALPAITASVDRSKLDFIFGASLIISFLLFGITFLIVTRGKALSRDMVRQKLAAEELRQTRDYLENLINYASAPIMTWDSAYRITRFNHAFENLTGYAADEVIGRELPVLFPQGSLDESLKKIARTSGGERWVSVEIPIVRKEGDIRTVLWNSANIYGQDRTTLVATIAQGVDITDRKQAEEALRESELHFRLLFEGSRDGFVSVDENGRFIDANKAYCRMLGYSINELKSITDFYRITPEKWHDWEREEIWQNQLLKNGYTDVYEKEYIRKDGTVFPAELQAYAVHDEEQHIDYFWGVARDITERKKANAERQRYQWILEKQLPPGTTDADEAQPCYGDLTKYNTRRVILDGIGKKNLAVMAADVMALLNTSLAVYEANGDYAYGVFKSSWCQFMDNAAYKRCGLDNARDALGCGKWLCHENCWHDSARAAIETGKATDIECVGGINLYAEPIFSDSEIIGVVNIGYGNPPQDDDSLHQLAEKFNISLELLREKSATYKPRPNFIIELAKKRCKYMAEMIGGIIERKKIEQTLQAKNDELIRFNYTVSHDLKSPLVTIKAFLGYLEQDMAKADPEKVANDLGHINTATDKMSALLDELLNIARIGHVTNPLVEAPLQEIVREALNLVAGRIAKRGVRLQVGQDPVLLYCDRVRLVEVFQNLIDNAVKFMGDQSEPLIEIGAEKKNGDTVCFVRDNGMGIDPRHTDKLFGLFQKLDANAEGTGIGLALVKRIIETHGGRIWVESEGIGKGACFWFTLPDKSSES